MYYINLNFHFDTLKTLENNEPKILEPYNKAAGFLKN